MYPRIKQSIDCYICILFLVFFGWLILLLALAVKLEDGGPVIFKQRRIGKNRKHFYIYKFRTMKVDTPKDVPTHLLEDPEKYITRVGKFMRKYSLDELPQIFNILQGKMAIVGPRPALWNQHDLVKLRDRYNANSVLPGLTGLAQINGRDELPIELKAKYDGDYVKKMSFFTDFVIIIRTFFSVLGAKGVKEGKD